MQSVTETSLSVWDTDMITKFIGTFTTSNVSKWSKAIVKELTSGDYKDQLSDWISCVDPSNSDVSSRIRNQPQHDIDRLVDRTAH